jgi:hypothetical protein
MCYKQQLFGRPLCLTDVVMHNFLFSVFTVGNYEIPLIFNVNCDVNSFALDMLLIIRFVDLFILYNVRQMLYLSLKKPVNQNLLSVTNY